MVCMRLSRMRPGPFIAAFLILATGALGWAWIKTPPAPQQQAQGKRGEGKRGGAPKADSAPVTVATVLKEAVPVLREGIGSVQALNTVIVRSQVEGRLMAVEFTEGQTVKKGDILARIDPTTYQAQLDQAVAKKAQDEATLANARLDLTRYQRLAQSNAGPKQQADQQAAVVAQLEAQVKADEGAVANARAILAYTTISAPLEGRTGLRSIDPGNIVRTGDANGLVSITQVKPMAIVFTLPQRDLSLVNTALSRGSVPVEVLDSDGRSVVARGQLQTVDNQIDISTGTIKLKATFPNDDLKLWPGQFVSTRVVVDTLADARVVPTAAVRRGPQGTFVYVIDAETKAIVRPVKVGLQDASRAVIVEGLTTGERVVTLGFSQLSNGKLVDIADTPSAPAPVPATPSPQDSATKAEAKPGEAKPDDQKRKRRERDAGGAADTGQKRVPRSGNPG